MYEPNQVIVEYQYHLSEGTPVRKRVLKRADSEGRRILSIKPPKRPKSEKRRRLY